MSDPQRSEEVKRLFGLIYTDGEAIKEGNECFSISAKSETANVNPAQEELGRALLEVVVEWAGKEPRTTGDLSNVVGMFLTWILAIGKDVEQQATMNAMIKNTIPLLDGMVKIAAVAKVVKDLGIDPRTGERTK
jgi:hypothetical protein